VASGSYGMGAAVHHAAYENSDSAGPVQHKFATRAFEVSN
jgi:hypothetical protein